MIYYLPRTGLYHKVFAFTCSVWTKAPEPCPTFILPHLFPYVKMVKSVLLPCWCKYPLMDYIETGSDVLLHLQVNCPVFVEVPATQIKRVNQSLLQQEVKGIAVVKVPQEVRKCCPRHDETPNLLAWRVAAALFFFNRRPPPKHIVTPPHPHHHHHHPQFPRRCLWQERPLRGDYVTVPTLPLPRFLFSWKGNLVEMSRGWNDGGAVVRRWWGGVKGESFVRKRQRDDEWQRRGGRSPVSVSNIRCSFILCDTGTTGTAALKGDVFNFTEGKKVIKKVSNVNI